MGNCLALEEKGIKVVKTDGKVLEYKSPLRVRQVLSEFAAGHAISQAFPATAVLEPDSRLRRGRVYYVFPLDLSSKFAETKSKKKVRFADDDDHKAAEEGEEINKGGGSSSVVRIKVVISKRELVEMIARGGVSVGDEMISSRLLQSQERRSTSLGGDDEDGDLSRSWKPALESIREVN
ncbi:uncharacterized protein LOC115741896 [Rhodamnia argentea]|uniref:Uncharacterized protein LOC115741896 n=1 Tax=Rhodamnia argentea TaxID=178133 RepID=A0A8B8PAG8_9MYRT|nr:uncharacterized protein LOC115741896 [Rhodamnia argentea]